MKKILFIFFTIFLFIGILSFIFVNATVDKGSPAFDLITPVYGSSQLIEGFIDIGLIDEPARNVITAIIDGEKFPTTLLTFLEDSKNITQFNFSCNPANCEDTFELQGSGETTKSLIFTNGEKFLGLKAEGENIIIDSLRFDIKGTSSSTSCYESPVKIDLLADNIMNWMYLEPEAGYTCSILNPSSCYNESAEVLENIITTSSYCQEKYLFVSKRFELGAKVKLSQGTAQAGDLVMYIDEDGESSECSLPVPTSDYSLKICEVNFTATKNKKYQICIYNKGSAEYKIKTEKQEPTCGMDYTDFALYAREAGFKPFTEAINLNSTSLLPSYIQEYINKFNGNCSGGCAIPIKIISNQNLELSNLSFRYKYGVSGILTESNKFYDLDIDSAKINMNQTVLPLTALSLKSPENHGDYKIKLEIGDVLLGEVDFSVGEIPIIHSVSPTNPPAGVEIEFTVNVRSPKNNDIVDYGWDFGDGTAITKTLINKKNHTYESGIYQLAIEVEDSEGLKAKKSFTITTGSPKEIVNQSIKRKKDALKNISSKIKNIPLWYREIVISALNIDALNLTLVSYEEEYSSPDVDYVALNRKLNELGVPIDIKDMITIGASTIIPDIEDIKPDYIRQLGGGEYDESKIGDIKKAISSWQVNSFDVIVSGSTKSAILDNAETKDIVTLLDIELKPKNCYENFYVIIDTSASFDDIIFFSEYGQQKINDATGFILTNETKTIKVALPGKQDIQELVIFVSASFDELELIEGVTCGNTICEPEHGENWRNCIKDCKPTVWGIIWIVLIIGAAVGGIIFIWKVYSWYYDRKQEKKLFKDRKDYYNLSVFVTNSFLKREKEESIREKLKKAGWSKAQINFIIQKIKKQKLKTKEKQKIVS